MVVQHTDNINNIHYKSGLYMYIDSCTIVIFISRVNVCGWVFWETYYELWSEYYLGELGSYMDMFTPND